MVRDDTINGTQFVTSIDQNELLTNWIPNDTSSRTDGYPMVISIFPSEIMTMILEFTDIRTLAKMCKTNHYLYHLGKELLEKRKSSIPWRISFSYDTNIKCNVNNILKKRIDTVDLTNKRLIAKIGWFPDYSFVIKHGIKFMPDKYDHDLEEFPIHRRYITDFIGVPQKLKCMSVLNNNEVLYGVGGPFLNYLISLYNNGAKIQIGYLDPIPIIYLYNIDKDKNIDLDVNDEIEKLRFKRRKLTHDNNIDLYGFTYKSIKLNK